MNKRWVALLVTVGLVFSLVGPLPRARAEAPQPTDVRVMVADRVLDAPLIAVGDRNLVPLRAVSDAVGATLLWDATTQGITLTLGSRVVHLQVGSADATVTEGGTTLPVTLAVPALLYDSRTYVPVRFVAEGLGCDVQYDAAARIIHVTPPAAGGPPPAGNWQAMDVNGDGKVDGADLAAMLTAPANIPVDVNGDGNKDTLDLFALMVYLTRWDRNGDKAVTAADFATAAPLALPAPDAKAAAALAAQMLNDAAKRVPPDLETRLRLLWTAQKTADPAVLASLYEQAGMEALLIGNLDEAQWAFGKSFAASPARDSALANLGFILAQEGKYQDALVLLARAREITPAACATSNNIGWVLARNGQDADARTYYQEAVAGCKKAGQYHLNLGATLLRLGDTAGAAAQFKEAARLSPHDREALIMAVASAPTKPATLDQYRAQYEKEDAAAVANGDTEFPTPWSDLGMSGQWDMIVAQESERVWKEEAQALKDLADATYKSLEGAAAKALPQGKSACDDLTRWANNWVATVDQMQKIVDAANIQATGIKTMYLRKQAAAEISLGPILLQMVLTEAQANMVNYANGDDARRAFDKTVHDDYERPMQEAAKRLSRTADFTQLDIPEASELFQSVILAGLMMPFAVLDPVYSASLDKCGTKPGGQPNWKIETDSSPALVLGIGVAEVEWKPETNEFKIQVGEGVLVAGTWSPKAGFGSQIGYGWEVGEGAFKAGQVTWLKRGSDGSTSIEIEGGGSAGVASWQVSASTQVRAASNEPIGAWPD
ncbi:MAG TPA: stalk domain-containing protein [Symbiobacteriaceae bacterium]|jgi:tetratricopeptide (TPR) repeat protein